MRPSEITGFPPTIGVSLVGAVNHVHFFYVRPADYNQYTARCVPLLRCSGMPRTKNGGDFSLSGQRVGSVRFVVLQPADVEVVATGRSRRLVNAVEYSFFQRDHNGRCDGAVQRAAKKHTHAGSLDVFRGARSFEFDVRAVRSWLSAVDCIVKTQQLPALCVFGQGLACFCWLVDQTRTG